MVTFTISVPWLLIVPAYISSLIVLSTGIDSPVIIDWSIVLIPFIIIPSAGTISPGRIFIMLFSFKFNAFIFSSLFLLIIVAVVGCNSISFLFVIVLWILLFLLVIHLFPLSLLFPQLQIFHL